MKPEPPIYKRFNLPWRADSEHCPSHRIHDIYDSKDILVLRLEGCGNEKETIRFICEAVNKYMGDASTRKDEGDLGRSNMAVSPTSPANYAGGPPERHGLEPSDSGITTPDRQGDALIAEPPAPNSCEIRVGSELSLLFALQSVCDYIRNRKNYGTQVAAKRRIEVLQKAEAAMQAFGDKSASKPEPVSVDLEKCAAALVKKSGEGFDTVAAFTDAIELTKAVLNAAGLAYVD